jgi:hypothetical protein
VQLYLALSEAVERLAESLTLSAHTADGGAREVCVRLTAVCSETSTSGNAASLWRIEPAAADQADALALRGRVTLRLGADGARMRLAAGGELAPLELHIGDDGEPAHGLMVRAQEEGADAAERFLEGELAMLDELLQAEPNRPGPTYGLCLRPLRRALHSSSVRAAVRRSSAAAPSRSAERAARESGRRGCSKWALMTKAHIISKLGPAHPTAPQAH